MKTCRACGIDKPLSEYYPHKAMADGYLNKCKTCVKSRVSKHREEHIERIRKYDRERGFRGAKGHTKRYSEQHPDRRRAQTLLANAIRSGKVIPWPVCAMPDCCDKPEGHHPDYSRPLDVVWLCPAHHKQAHAIARRQA